MIHETLHPKTTRVTSICLLDQIFRPDQFLISCPDLTVEAEAQAGNEVHRGEKEVEVPVETEKEMTSLEVNQVVFRLQTNCTRFWSVICPKI